MSPPVTAQSEAPGSAVDPSVCAVAIGLLLLRSIAGVLIFLVHGWHKVLEAFAHFHRGASWRLVDEIAEMRLPLPLLFAVGATLVQFICAPLLVVGWWARTAAALLAGVLGGAALQNVLAGRDPQLALLYVTTALALAFTGPGRISLDHRRCRSAL